MVLSVTQDSAADTEQTVTIARGTKKRIFVRTLTVTTSGADTASDVGIYVKDNGVTVWKGVLRLAKVFGGHFDFGKGIPIRAGDLTVVVDDAGALCITTASVVYEVV